MSQLDQKLHRLLQAAAAAPAREEEPAMPFGFETRVVALSRAARGANGRETGQLMGFIRRVTLVAVIVTAFASSAAYWQLNENDAQDESLTNVYAIADSVMEPELFQ